MTEAVTSLRRQAAHGLVWQTINTIVRQVITLIVGVLLARLFTPAQFGILNLAIICLSWVSLLGNAGVAEGLIQSKKMAPGHEAAAFWLAGSVGLISAIILACISGLLSNLFALAELDLLLRWYALNLLLGGLLVVPGALLRRHLSFSRVALVEITGTLVSNGSGLLLVLNGIGIVSIPIGGILGLLVQWGIYKILGVWRAWRWPGLLTLRRLGTFQIFAGGARIAELLRISVDNLMVGRFLGAAALGYYSLSYNLSAIPEYRVVGLITSIAFPAFSRLQENQLRLATIYAQLIRYVTLVVAPILLGLMALADSAIPLVYGDTWLPAVPILRVLCLAGLGCSLAVATDSVLLSGGWSRYMFLANWVWVLSLIGGLIGVFLLGAGVIWVAWVTAIVGLTMAIVRNIFAAHLTGLGLRSLAKAVGRPLGASALMVGLVIMMQRLLWPGRNWGSLLVLVMVGGCVYAPLVYIMVPEIRSDVSAVLNLIWKRLQPRKKNAGAVDI